MTHLDTPAVSTVGASRLSSAREHLQAVAVLIGDAPPWIADRLAQFDDELFCQLRRTGSKHHVE